MQLSSAKRLESLARLGFAAKGMVYGIVGFLAAQAAAGGGGKTTDTQGALQTIAVQPFGQFLLALVAFGLAGYGLWRWVEAIFDPENHGSNPQGILKRIGYGINGLLYAGLAVTAVQIILGSIGDGGDRSVQDWTATLLSWPLGRWLVGIGGLAIAGMGGYQFYRAYSAKFRRKLKLQQMHYWEQKWAIRLGRFGFATRGVTFLIIGGFLILAAVQFDPQEARGLAGSLATLQQQPYGPWLLGIVAFGLIAYGIYMVFEARYRQILAPDLAARIGIEVRH